MKKLMASLVTLDILLVVVPLAFPGLFTHGQEVVLIGLAVLGAVGLVEYKRIKSN